MRIIVILPVFFAIIVATSRVESVYSETSSIRKSITNCLTKEDTISCLSIEGISILNNISSRSSIKILPGISFQRDSSDSGRSDNTISDNEIAETMQDDKSQRYERLLGLAMNSLANFIESYSLKIKFPGRITKIAARFIEEGRGKLKKAIKSICAKIVAFAAFKALILAKIALYMHLQQGKMGKLVGVGYASHSEPVYGPSAAGVHVQQYPYSRERDYPNF